MLQSTSAVDAWRWNPVLLCSKSQSLTYLRCRWGFPKITLASIWRGFHLLLQYIVHFFLQGCWLCSRITSPLLQGYGQNIPYCWRLLLCLVLGFGQVLVLELNVKVAGQHVYHKSVMHRRSQQTAWWALIPCESLKILSRVTWEGSEQLVKLNILRSTDRVRFTRKLKRDLLKRALFLVIFHLDSETIPDDWKKRS